MPASSSRHCERSEAIQCCAHPLWIATSPAAPRNDGTSSLRSFAVSRETIFGTRRREGAKRVGVRKYIVAFASLALITSPLQAEESVDVLTSKGLTLYRSCVVSEAMRLDDGKETAIALAGAALMACRAARVQMGEIMTSYVIHKTPQLPKTVENRASAEDAAAMQMDTIDKYVTKRAVLEVLEARKLGK